jgi:hypothetical protein
MSVPEKVLSLHRRECGERRRHAEELRRLAERLRSDAARVRAEIDAAGGADPLLLERDYRLERSVGEIEGQLTAAYEALAAAEQQLRRHERAIADRALGPGLAERRLARRTKAN